MENKEVQPNTSGTNDLPESGQEKEAIAHTPKPVFEVVNPDRPRFRPDPTLQEVKDIENVRKLFTALNKQVPSQQPPEKPPTEILSLLFPASLQPFYAVTEPSQKAFDNNKTHL